MLGVLSERGLHGCRHWKGGGGRGHDDERKYGTTKEGRQNYGKPVVQDGSENAILRTTLRSIRKCVRLFFNLSHDSPWFANFRGGTPMPPAWEKISPNLMRNWHKHRFHLLDFGFCEKKTEIQIMPHLPHVLELAHERELGRG